MVEARPREGSTTAPRGRSFRWLWLIVAGLAALAVLTTFFGPVAVPPLLILQIFGNQLTGGHLFGYLTQTSTACSSFGLPDPCSTYVTIVWQIRLPAIVLAVGVGAALGLSGATLQGVFRNPLADPYLLGISSGGTLGAVIAYLLLFGGSPLGTIVPPNFLLPLFAFVGSVGTGLLILAIARSRAGSVETLLLAGVALSSLLSAIVALLTLYNRQTDLQVEYWLLGSVANAEFPQVLIVFSVLTVASLFLLVHGRELNLLQLGDEVAQSAGVDPRAVRLRLILLASVTTAIAVAFAGIIGFIGLIAPHVVRRLVSVDYRVVLVGSLAVGAALLLVAWDVDLFFSELPIGIFTAFAGVPFFLYILFRQGRRTTMGGA
ncbi:MAG: FecCD family ABC transporter permease [Thermoplasmata archaeon]